MSERILVAGCLDQTQNILCELFHRAGMSVKSAVTVDHALGFLQNAPSLIVVDLAMQSGNGLQVVKAARTDLPLTKLAVVSCGTFVPEAGWIARYRPDAIFGKPFDLVDFVDWLKGFDLSDAESLPAKTHFQPGMSRAA